MKKIFIAALLACVIIGCKNSDKTSNPQPVKSSKLLPDSVVEYSYDQTYIGGIDTIKSLYQYDNENRMISETNETDRYSKSYIYDSNGNLIEIKSTSENYLYNYDYLIKYASNLPVNLTSQYYNTTFTFIDNNSVLIIKDAYSNVDSVSFVGNNVTKYYNGPGGGITAYYSYGKNNGPFSGVDFKIYLGNIMPFFTRNEIVSSIMSTPNLMPVYNLVNTYNNYGYPTKQVWLDKNGNPSDIINYTYVAAK